MMSDRWQPTSIQFELPHVFIVYSFSFSLVQNWDQFLNILIVTAPCLSDECDHLLGPAAGALLMTAAQARPASQSRSRSLVAWAWLRWTRINTSNSRLSRHRYEWFNNQVFCVLRCDVIWLDCDFRLVWYWSELYNLEYRQVPVGYFWLRQEP